MKSSKRASIAAAGVGICELGPGVGMVAAGVVSGSFTESFLRVGAGAKSCGSTFIKVGG